MVTTSSTSNSPRRTRESLKRSAARVREPVTPSFDPRGSVLRTRTPAAPSSEVGHKPTAGKLSLLQQRIARTPLPPATTPDLSAAQLNTGVAPMQSSNSEAELPAFVQLASRSLELGTALPLFHGSNLPYVSVGQRIQLQLTSSQPYQEPSRQLDAYASTHAALEQVKTRLRSADHLALPRGQDNYAQLYAPLQLGAQQLVWREPTRALSINLAPFPYMHAHTTRVQRLFQEVGSRFNEHLTSLLLLSKGQQLEQELHNWAAQEYASLEAVQSYPQLARDGVVQYIENAARVLNPGVYTQAYLRSNPRGLELVAQAGLVDQSLLPSLGHDQASWSGAGARGHTLPLRGAATDLRTTLDPNRATTALPLLVTALEGDMYLDAQLTLLQYRARSYYPQPLGQPSVPRVNFALSNEMLQRIEFLQRMRSGMLALRTQQYFEREVAQFDKNYAYFLGSTLRLANRRMLEVAEYSVLTRALIARTQANNAYLVMTNQLEDIVENGLTYRQYLESVFQVDDVDFTEGEQTREPLEIVFDDGQQGITKDLNRAAYQAELERLKFPTPNSADATEKKTIEPPSAVRSTLGATGTVTKITHSSGGTEQHTTRHNHEEPNSPQYQAYENLEVGLLEHGDALSLSRDVLAEHGISIPSELESTYQAVQEQRNWESQLRDFQQNVAQAVDQQLQASPHAEPQLGWDTPTRLAHQVRRTWEPLARASFSAQTQARSFGDLDLQRSNWELAQSIGVAHSPFAVDMRDDTTTTSELDSTGRYVPDLYRNLESASISPPPVARHWLVPRSLWSRTYTPQVLEQLVHIRAAAAQAEANWVQEYGAELQREQAQEARAIQDRAASTHPADELFNSVSANVTSSSDTSIVLATHTAANPADVVDIGVSFEQLNQQVLGEWQGADATDVAAPATQQDVTIQPNLANTATRVTPANNFPAQTGITYSTAARPTAHLRADLSRQIAPQITLNRSSALRTEPTVQPQAQTEGKEVAAVQESSFVAPVAATTSQESAPEAAVQQLTANMADSSSTQTELHEQANTPAASAATPSAAPQVTAHTRREVRLAVLASELRTRVLHELSMGKYPELRQLKGVSLIDYDTRYWLEKMRRDEPEVWLTIAMHQLEYEDEQLHASLHAVDQLSQEITHFVVAHQDSTTSYVSYLPVLVRVAPQVLFLGDMTVHSATKLAALRAAQGATSLSTAVTGANLRETSIAATAAEPLQGVDLRTVADGWMDDALRTLARRQLHSELGPLGLVTVGTRTVVRPLPELDCPLLRNLPHTLVQARAQARASTDLSFQLKVRQELALYLWKQQQCTLAEYHATRALEVNFPDYVSAAQREIYHSCYNQLRDELIHADREFTLELGRDPLQGIFWEEVALGTADENFTPQLHHLRVQQRLGVSGKPNVQHALRWASHVTTSKSNATSRHYNPALQAQPYHFQVNMAGHNGLTCWWFAQVRSYYPQIHSLRKQLTPSEPKVEPTASQAAFTPTLGMVDPSSNEYRHHQATTLHAQRFWCLNNHLPLVQEQGEYVTVMSGLNFTRSSRLFYLEYEWGTSYVGADLGLAYYRDLEPLYVEGIYYDLNWYQPTYLELFWSTTHPELQYHRLNLLQHALTCEQDALTPPQLASLLWNYISSGAAARRCAVRGTLTSPAWLGNFKVAYPNKVGMYKPEADTTYMVLEPSTFHHKWEGQNLTVELAFARGRYQRPAWYLGNTHSSLRWSEHSALNAQLDAYIAVQLHQLTTYYGIKRASKLTPSTSAPAQLTCEIFATIDLGGEASSSLEFSTPDVTEE